MANIQWNNYTDILESIPHAMATALGEIVGKIIVFVTSRCFSGVKKKLRSELTNLVADYTLQHVNQESTNLTLVH